MRARPFLNGKGFKRALNAIFKYFRASHGINMHLTGINLCILPPIIDNSSIKLYYISGI